MKKLKTEIQKHLICVFVFPWISRTDGVFVIMPTKSLPDDLAHSITPSQRRQETKTQ